MTDPIPSTEALVRALLDQTPALGELRVAALALVARTRELEAALSEEVVDGVETAQRLRTKLAETEAALVGLRAAMEKQAAVYTGDRVRCILCGAKAYGSPLVHQAECPLTPSAALGARVIEEAERRGEERAAAEADYLGEIPMTPPKVLRTLKCMSPEKLAASIEAAREEGRAEERAKGVGLGYEAAAQAEAALDTVTAERDEARAVLDKLLPDHHALTIAHGTALAERDEARRERDEAKGLANRAVVQVSATMGRAAVADDMHRRFGKLERDLAEAIASRDAALAKLSEVEAAVRRDEAAQAAADSARGEMRRGDATFEEVAAVLDEERAAMLALTAALSAPAPLSLSRLKAEVRRETIEGCASAWEAARPDGVRGRTNVTADEVAAWLRSLADRGGGA